MLPPMWSPLLRRLLRALVGLGLRQAIRHGRRAARAREGRPRPTVIDVERVDAPRPFERFSEPARRAVAHAADLHGAGGPSSAALLLALLDTHEPTAAALAGAGLDVTAVRRRLREAVAAAGPLDGPTDDARRVLRGAPAAADRRGARRVEPRDLREVLLASSGELAGLLEALPPPGLGASVPHGGTDAPGGG